MDRSVFNMLIVGTPALIFAFVILIAVLARVASALERIAEVVEVANAMWRHDQ